MSDFESAVEVFIWLNESHGLEMMYHGPQYSHGAFAVKLLPSEAPKNLL